MGSETARKSPDTILNELRSEGYGGGGRLKIFFGYAAGVGKTYAMLEAAHELVRDGVDVVIGYVESHVRPDTQALTEGLEQVPLLSIERGAVVLSEFDLDAALQRAPQVILVDELAHTNRGDVCRHRKRYQDIEELLHAGIDVYTTLNVQHLESMHDKVAMSTEVSVREHVPDRVFDKAASVELIDIEPADLIERLKAGRIYAPGRVQPALDHFFSQKNLAALREMALRRTADRPDGELFDEEAGSSYVRNRASEDVLVYVTSHTGCARVIRSAANMARAYHGNLIALVVEESRGSQSGSNGTMLRNNIEFAESFGARVVSLSDDDPVRQIGTYAPAAGITKIVVGSIASLARRAFIGDPFVNRLAKLAPNAQITMVPEKNLPRREFHRSKFSQMSFHWSDVGMALVAVAVATVIGMLLDAGGLSDSVILMMYLMAIMVFATRVRGISYSLIAAVVGMLAFNFFFTAPRLTFSAYGSSYPFIFAFFAAAAFVASSLTIRINAQADAAAQRAFHTEVLLDSNRKLQQARTKEECFGTLAEQVCKLLNRSVAVHRSDGRGSIGNSSVFGMPGLDVDSDEETILDDQERAVAAWVVANGEEAGVSTDTLMHARCLYLPVMGKTRVHGAVGVAMEGSADRLDPFEKNLLVAILDGAGASIDQIELAYDRQAAKLESKTEELRSNLLRSVSHDFRTPLTSISGDAEVLITESASLSEEKKQRLYADIRDDSSWLVNLVENLLTITRADDGKLDVRLEPELIDDVVAEAVTHVDRNVAKHTLTLDIDDGVLLALMDARLIVQVVVNLVNNAVKFTPDYSEITVYAYGQDDFVRVGVRDGGPGISADEKPHVFEMFYNGSAGRSVDATRSMGLGLALCKSIVEEHGGRIGVDDRVPHGCDFWFTLPRVVGQGGE